MLKALLAFGLTRRAIIVLGLLVFIGAGLAAFYKLNIEAYPNPAPVILEITAQATALSVEGPKDFGLTNLHTVEDWIVLRRLSTIPGVVQVNSFGAPTKEFEVEADLGRLQAYNVTLPQLVAALGNANINVGGRDVAMGQDT